MLQTGQTPRPRFRITKGISTVVIPVMHMDHTFGELHYCDSGLRADDGAQIWTNQEHGTA